MSNEKQAMHRPALVIGLGGTGVLALRHLKASLKSSQDGQLPPQVRLVALDTVKEEKDASQTAGAIPIAALRTDLEPGEYYWIGGDVYEFVRQVDHGEQPHISSWFQAKSYLEVLPRASFTLERGAGQLRQFGRLAIFKDVSAPANSAIRSLLNRAINDIRRTGHFEAIDVFLVASVAGGTGAGMFTDIAYLVRQIAKQEHNLAIRLRGFLVLPEAFSAIPGGIKDSMRARAFACMRENKRFMVDFDYAYGYPMYYHSSGIGGVWRNTIHTKLFDFLYHVDGQSKQNPLTNVLPEHGVTAAVADAIAAMLDKPPVEEGGEDVYDRHTTNVVAEAGLGEGAEKSTSFDSGFGSYSLILPMHQISEWLSYRLTRNALDRLLPASQKDEDGYLLRLAPDQNGESLNVRGKDNAGAFLDAADIVSFKTNERVSGTPFLREIKRVATNYSDKDDVMARELSGREAKDWELQLDPPGTSADIVAVRNRVQQILAQQLTSEVPANQKGESPGSAFDRITRGVEAYKGRILGREDVRTGQYVGGQYRQYLGEYADKQLERYRLMLAIEIENILNGGMGQDDPPSVRKGGKLGYLLDWFDGLESQFGRFLKAMAEARKRREERREKQDAVEAAQSARQDLESKPGGLLGGRRRQGYLEAEEDLIDIEKTLLAEGVAVDVASKMLEHTRGLHANASEWADVFGVSYESLYARLLRGEKRILDAIRVEQQVPVREYLWDQAYLDDLYQKYAEDLHQGIDEILDRLDWRHQERRSGVTTRFGIQPVITVTEDDDRNRLGAQNQEQNLELLLTPARAIFADAWKQESVLKYLMNRKFTAPNALATHLAGKISILLDADAKSVVPANYLHVAHGTHPSEGDYLAKVRQGLANRTEAKGKLNDIVNSAERFVLRLIYTLDLIPLEGVKSYTAAESAYWNHGGELDNMRETRGRMGRETLHLFPAEVNAARLETRIAGKLRIQPRALHNDVVLQMEDMANFRLFVRCWAYNLIHRDRQDWGQGYENFYCLDLPAMESSSIVRGATPEERIFLTRPEPGKDPEIVHAMRNWTYEQKDVRTGVNVPVDFDRARDAVKQARDEIVKSRIAAGKGIDVATTRDRAEALLESDKSRFKSLWVERAYLQEMQKQLKDEEIFNTNRSRPQQDAAIAMYMVIDDDVESLITAMDDILRQASRLK